MRGAIVLVALAAIGCGHSSSPTDEALAGHWVGSYVVRQCTPSGWPSCADAQQQIGSVHALDLTLTQSSSSATGTLQVTESPDLVMPVNGSVAAGALSITGTVVTPFINRFSTEKVTVTRWTSGGDNGRMTGTFSVRRETLWGSGNMEHPPGSTWTLDLEAELVNVVRQP
jgi:hypothetical protein